MRLPGPDDPLTVDEQLDLERQVTKGALRSLLPSEFENVLRLAATLRFYRGFFERARIHPDEALPARTVLNGIAYLPGELSPITNKTRS